MTPIQAVEILNLYKHRKRDNWRLGKVITTEDPKGYAFYSWADKPNAQINQIDSFELTSFEGIAVAERYQRTRKKKQSK